MIKGKPLLALVLILLCAMTGCSRKLVVLSLDDAIKTVSDRLNEARCSGAPLTNPVSAEFYVKTAYQLSAGAPTGAIPITLSGTSSAEESTKVTVSLNVTSQPCDKKLMEQGSPPMFYHYDPSKGMLEKLTSDVFNWFW